METAFPDFGFKDPLNFDLRGGDDEQSGFRDTTYSIWHYMYNYIAEKPKFERFNNIVEKLSQDKRESMISRIREAKQKQQRKAGQMDFLRPIKSPDASGDFKSLECELASISEILADEKRIE